MNEAMENEDEMVQEIENENEEENNTGEIIITSRTCIGIKCHLTQTPKQFNSKVTKNREGPKKCPM